MKKQQVDHILRAAGDITGETQFIIIGSQSLHGKYPDLPDDLVMSAEVDLVAKKHPDRTEWLVAIGQGSQFHEAFGYYADPIDERTATLPHGWKGRLVNLPAGDTKGVIGLCLDPHDLAISKYIASRPKDRDFTAAMVQRGLLDRNLLLERLQATKARPQQMAAARAAIDRDFLRASEDASRKPATSKRRKDR